LNYFLEFFAFVQKIKFINWTNINYCWK